MVATFVLHSERDRRFALAAVVKARAGDKPDQVRISRPTRNDDQNRYIHALLNDISDQLGWPPNTGELHDLIWWKRRTTLQWLLDRKERPEVITALEDEGEFAILLPHTSDLDVPQCAEYVEWLYGFGGRHGVVFKKPKREEPPPSAEAYEAFAR